MTELRQDYKDKVKAFTHIIDICMKDNARKEEDWKLQAEVSLDSDCLNKFDILHLSFPNALFSSLFYILIEFALVEIRWFAMRNSAYPICDIRPSRYLT